MRHPGSEDKSLRFVCQHQTLFRGKRHNGCVVKAHMYYRSSVCSLGIAAHLLGCLKAAGGNDAALTTLWQISTLQRLWQDGEKISWEVLIGSLSSVVYFFFLNHSDKCLNSHLWSLSHLQIWFCKTAFQAATLMLLPGDATRGQCPSHLQVYGLGAWPRLIYLQANVWILDVNSWYERICFDLHVAADQSQPRWSNFVHDTWKTWKESGPVFRLQEPGDAFDLQVMSGADFKYLQFPKSDRSWKFREDWQVACVIRINAQRVCLCLDRTGEHQGESSRLFWTNDGLIDLYRL